MTLEFVALFDHLVGRHLQGLRHGKPKRFGGVEIDNQLEFRRLQYRQVSGPRPQDSGFR
jgi:hypothetical protein